jgi:pimeloyl-ACP methyl ester carboxylesterase
MPETVVLVHGIWMTGLELSLLGWRLRKYGYRTVTFRYHSLLKPLAHNAARLAARLRRLEGTTIHLVGHSLGGLVILQALQERPNLVDGRIVLLGSPVNGSIIAQRVYRCRLCRWLVGRSAANALLGGGPRWRGAQSLGVIAGTRPVGVGSLLGGFEGVNDGTVALSETALANASASISVNSSHFGLVVSQLVAAQVHAFLSQGRFDLDDN